MEGYSLRVEGRALLELLEGDKPRQAPARAPERRPPGWAGAHTIGHVFGDASTMVVFQRQAERGGAVGPAGSIRGPLHRITRTFSNGLLGLGALSAALLVIAGLLGGARPAWWRTAPGAADRRSLAGAVDNGAWTVVTELRPMVVGEHRTLSEPWSVSLTADAATAWLNEKLPRWLASQANPARLPVGAELQAAFERGAVHIGIRLPEGDAADKSGRYISLSLRPRIDCEGLWLPATTVSVGRLDVPAGALLVSAGNAPRGSTGGSAVRFSPEVAALLHGRAPALRGASIRLPDGRTVRLLKVEPLDDRLVLTMQTESAK